MNKEFLKLDRRLQKAVLQAQRNEISEHHIYKLLASSQKDEKNKKILERIAGDELRHYKIWQKVTGVSLTPDRRKIFQIRFLTQVFGLVFGVMLMEQGEAKAQIAYQAIDKKFQSARRLKEEEKAHELKLLGLINEDRLNYVSSVALGLNDALVELTGALAGLTFALQNSRLIAATGLITGLAASLSMASSEYLATEFDEENKTPIKASIYTGITYLLTVIFLITPFLVLRNYYLALTISLIIAILTILGFSYYVSVARNMNFSRRFFKMALISLGVAGISFFIGIAVRNFFGIEI